MPAFAFQISLPHSPPYPKNIGAIRWSSFYRPEQHGAASITGFKIVLGRTNPANSPSQTGIPSPGLQREGLEDAWRSRFEMARERYKQASAHYRELVAQQPEGIIPREDSPLALARQAESEALAEYSRILKVFTELTIRGRIPEEELTGKEADVDRRHFDLGCRR